MCPAIRKIPYLPNTLLWPAHPATGFWRFNHEFAPAFTRDTREQKPDKTEAR